MQFSTSVLNPFGDLGDLQKAHHVFAVGDKVTYLATGHKGKLSNVDHGIYYVTLDSGHVIGCSRSDLVPSDFPPAERPTRQTAMAEPDADTSAKLAAASNRLGKSTAGLENALRAGRVTAGEATLIKLSLRQMTEASVLNPFGMREDDLNVRTLDNLCEQYSKSAGTGDTFTKRSTRPGEDPEFSVGQTVRYKCDGRKGKIVKLDYGFARVVHDAGEIHVPCGDLEACAA